MAEAEAVAAARVQQPLALRDGDPDASQQLQQEQQIDNSGDGVLRAQTPFAIFKKDWLSRQRAAGIPRNPTVRSTWIDCKSDFADLGAEDLRLLQARAEATVPIAAANRKRKKERQAAMSSDAGTHSTHAAVAPARVEAEGGALDPRIGNADALSPLVKKPLPAAQPPFPKRVVCQSLRVPIMAQATSSSCLPPGHDPEYPIDASAVRCRLTHEGYTAKADVASWKERSSRIAAGPSVPDVVEYPTHCGALCVQDHTGRVLNFHSALQKMVQGLVRAVSPGGVISRVAHADLVFVAEGYVAETLAGAGPRTPDMVKFFAVG